VILFGQGGVAVEVIGDRAVALPPGGSICLAGFYYRHCAGHTSQASCSQDPQ
jgi:hypothetical protein